MDIVMEDDPVLELAQELRVPLACANDVLYLRTRNRHTQALEEQLIELWKAGTPPNIYEFGSTPATQQALIDKAMRNVIGY